MQGNMRGMSALNVFNRGHIPALHVGFDIAA